MFLKAVIGNLDFEFVCKIIMKKKFELKFIETLVFSNYGIKIKATQIYGETDDNFKLQSKNKSYFFKIYPKKTDPKFVEFQSQLLLNLNTNKKTANNNLTLDEKCYATFLDKENHIRYFRMNDWIQGRLWSSVNPINSSLRKELGSESAKLIIKLNQTKLDYKRDDFDWDLSNYLWIERYYKKFDIGRKRKNIIKKLLENLKDNDSKYKRLRKRLIHNDLNDNNIIVSEDLKNPKILGFIDFGDCIKSQLINELAITCTYGIINSLNPLNSACDIVKGFNQEIPVTEIEIEFLYDLILIRISISILKSALNEKYNPENNYLQVSKNDMLSVFDKWSKIDRELALHFFRNACNFTPNVNEKKFNRLIRQNKSSIDKLFGKNEIDKLQKLDLSVSSNWLSSDLINDIDLFEKKINQNSSSTFFGGYSEIRAVYDSSDYERLTENGFENRTTHLGLDFWVKEKTSIHAIEKGIIKTITNDKTKKGYGGLIIIEHKIDDIKYYSLYGHLENQRKAKIKVGDLVIKGQKIAKIGSIKENGGWSPHLHFQIMLTLLDYKNDFPGVCLESEKKVWLSICPNPKLILDIKETPTKKIHEDKLKVLRKKYLPSNLKLSYNSPIYVVRGFNQYLYSNKGKKYLDTVNNIAHVGHQNLKVVRAAKEQIGVLNTNTRYLHDEIIALSKNLVSKFPEKLSKVYLVNSGSEANELAIRMSNVFGNCGNYIVFQGGYHGNTNKTIEVSNYKYNSKGGSGKAKNIFEIPMPDEFRGKFRGGGAGIKYFKEFEKIISKAKKANKKISAMIVEPIISCGGQVELPEKFLKNCKKILEKENILLIVDEVQTGFGRVGEKFWGFQLHDVIPDIVTLGKPMGNGHPIGAVICNEEISKKFDNGLEFFSSFGGNPVSCKIANEVIKELDSKNLQKNALVTGRFLISELKKLSKKYSIIGSVRGKGLFIGVELVNQDLVPEKHKAIYLVNRMKELGVLMSNDGLDKNVIKIKPPMIFSIDDSKKLILLLDKVLGEDYMISN